MKKLAAILIVTSCLSNLALAEQTNGYFLKPYVGVSQMSDLKADTSAVGSANGLADIDLDSGFVAGLGFGYRYTPELAVELAWEYRSNDSETTLPDGELFKDGNYASNLFFLNGYYFFPQNDKWEFYVGAGLSWAQEIDIDLEEGGEEKSFSGDGDIGYQFFAGSNYLLNDSFSINTELRYGSITGIELEGEGSAGKIDDIDYETLGVNLGLNYYF